MNDYVSMWKCLDKFLGNFIKKSFGHNWYGRSCVHNTLCLQYTKFCINHVMKRRLGIMRWGLIIQNLDIIFIWINENLFLDLVLQNFWFLFYFTGFIFLFLFICFLMDFHRIFFWFLFAIINPCRFRWCQPVKWPVQLVNRQPPSMLHIKIILRLSKATSLKMAHFATFSTCFGKCHT